MVTIWWKRLIKATGCKVGKDGDWVGKGCVLFSLSLTLFRPVIKSPLLALFGRESSSKLSNSLEVKGSGPTSLVAGCALISGTMKAANKQIASNCK